MNHADVIVIGGGLGGLTAAAKLSREGKKVLLIEQHTVPGGCATTFRRKEFRVEAGLHAMDGLDAEDPKMPVFRELGVLDHIEFVEVPEFYRFKSSTRDIVIPANGGEAMRVLITAFPDEEQGIRRFFHVIHAIRSEINRLPAEPWKSRLLMPLFPLLFPHLSVATSKRSTVLFPLFPLLHADLVSGDYSTVGHFVDAVINSEELKLILLANFGYYHDDPNSLSLVFFSAAQASYYSGGGHFIKGGSQKLSDYLAGYITDHGGTVMLGHLVTRILTANGRAVGVACRKTREPEAEEQIILADAIVANAAIPNVEAMLPQKERALLQKKTAGFKPSCCVLNLYLGFKSEVSSLNNRAYSTFVYDGEAKTLKEVVANVHGDFSRRGFTFVDYSQIDSGLAPKGKSFGSLCTIDYLSDWEGLSEEEYRKKKERVSQLLIERLEKLIPGISREIEYHELATARTVRRYTLNPGGAIYGYAQIPGQSGILRRPANKSQVKNLYFASAWSNPGGGFTGAILSGWFCAKALLHQ